jgi:hypothetical protein
MEGESLMYLMRPFLKARPNATFKNGANSSSLEILNSRYDGEDKVTQDEIDAALPECIEEDRRENIYTQLADTDVGIIRVIEDLITILIQKGTIDLSNFSQPVQDKILARKALRDEMNGG